MLTMQPRDWVLDIVYGGGYLINRMSGLVTDGFLVDIDISPNIVANAMKRYQQADTSGKMELKYAVPEPMPYPENCFAKVCSVCKWNA